MGHSRSPRSNGPRGSRAEPVTHRTAASSPYAIAPDVSPVFPAEGGPATQVPQGSPW